jgi:hypothetical protein
MRVFPINTLEAKQRALRAVWQILGSDGEEVVIRKRVESGSKEQQAWFNMQCGMIAKETGNTPEAIKAHCKVEAFGMQEGELAGKKFEFIPRSDLHGMAGFSQLIEKANEVGAELGIVLPDPDPNWSKKKKPVNE